MGRGLTVRAQDSESSVQRSCHGRGHCVVFLCKTLKTLTAHLFAQVYKVNTVGSPVMD